MNSSVRKYVIINKRLCKFPLFTGQFYFRHKFFNAGVNHLEKVDLCEVVIDLFIVIETAIL